MLVSHQKNLTVCDNRVVLLLCEGNLDPTLKPASAIWKFQDDAADTMKPVEETNLGHFIKYEKPNMGVNNPLSYLVVHTHNKTSGAYQCIIVNDEGEMLESETSWITVEGKLLAMNIFLLGKENFIWFSMQFINCFFYLGKCGKLLSQR